MLSKSPPPPPHTPPTTAHTPLHRYKGVLVTMMESVLHKVMLQYNIDELREVDDDAIDDDVSYYMKARNL